MPARILIVDSVATNRIVLNVKLIAARYDVDAASDMDEARALLRTATPDLILLAASYGDREAICFCRDVKAMAATADVPVIMVGDFSDPERRLTALKAGADDVLSRPLHDQVLHARIRSLLRARNAAAELRLRDDTHRALGLAEAAPLFTAKGRITMIGSDATLDIGELTARARTFSELTGHHCAAMNLDDAQGLSSGTTDPIPDVVLIDGSGLPRDRLAEVLPRLVSELRSGSDTRNIGQVAVLPADAEDVAAILLDIGVDDVVEAPVSDSELALRVNAAMLRKQQHERLRKTVRDGLRAAVTDPLTGLYNRRYAQPHLIRLAEQAREAGTDYAVMVLDIDHFKSINDRYGHGVGDRVLAGVGAQLMECVRSVDLVARIGGEEFLIAMPDTGPAEARDAAERIREAISSTRFDIGGAGAPIRVTMSIGVATAACMTPDALRTYPDTLFDRADAALYGAKSSGRNMVNMDLSAA